MKDQITIKLEPMEAKILFNELRSVILTKEHIKERAYHRMRDRTLDEAMREVSKDSYELLSYQTKIYRDICNKITKSIFCTK